MNTTREVYEKLNKEEYIQVGDLISLDPFSNKVKLAKNKFNDPDKQVIRGLYKN